MDSAGAGNTELPDRTVTKEKFDISGLMWVKGKANNQYLDMMIDSGASMSCIASRCVNASPHLKNVTRLPYSGPGLVGVNGKPLRTLFEIKIPLTLGSPQLSITLHLVVVDDLPYSCILGLNFLRKFNTWEVDNINGNL